MKKISTIIIMSIIIIFFCTLVVFAENESVEVNIVCPEFAVKDEIFTAELSVECIGFVSTEAYVEIIYPDEFEIVSVNGADYLGENIYWNLSEEQNNMFATVTFKVLSDFTGS